jgi:hypothetical protein
MVVAERFTPSGRRIPDAKMHGGIGWEKMFDVYGYEGCLLEEVCARYVRTAESLGECICGPSLTDKFTMWRLYGGRKVHLAGAMAVVVVTDGEGAVNGIQVKRGDRLVVVDEAEVSAAGSISAIVCFKAVQGA